MTSEGNTASSTNTASYAQTTHPNDLFESPSSENQDFASHSALCKNIAIARDYARSYQDLKDAYAESSTLENARSKLIVSLTDVSQARTISGDSSICMACTAHLTDRGAEWYKGKLQTDLWELESEIAQVGLKLE
ncbi:uncharacterized protein L199_008120 [Kwoniella botswanensis]|uniref:uncharacterized protein n=1 Tax=Kwoniella botswanensis TaxID=1268659 RepID=UPI00315CC74F